MDDSIRATAHTASCTVTSSRIISFACAVHRQRHSVHPKQPQTKMATKQYQNKHIQLANEKSVGHQILIVTRLL